MEIQTVEVVGDCASGAHELDIQLEEHPRADTTRRIELDWCRDGLDTNELLPKPMPVPPHLDHRPAARSSSRSRSEPPRSAQYAQARFVPPDGTRARRRQPVLRSAAAGRSGRPGSTSPAADARFRPTGTPGCSRRSTRVPSLVQLRSNQSGSANSSRTSMVSPAVRFSVVRTGFFTGRS